MKPLLIGENRNPLKLTHKKGICFILKEMLRVSTRIIFKHPGFMALCESGPRIRPALESHCNRICQPSQGSSTIMVANHIPYVCFSQPSYILSQIHISTGAWLALVTLYTKPQLASQPSDCPFRSYARSSTFYHPKQPPNPLFWQGCGQELFL
jgi:hypothetical protein